MWVVRFGQDHITDLPCDTFFPLKPPLNSITCISGQAIQGIIDGITLLILILNVFH